jgi:hypothetical protein
MGIIVEVEESGFTGFIEDGEICTARLVSVDLKEKPFVDDKTGEKVKKFEFKFRIDDPSGAHDGQLVWGETPTRMTDHPDNRFRIWAEALLGQRLMAHHKVNTDDLQDRDCRIIVGKSVKQQGTSEKIRNFVREVHPTRENAAKLAADDASEPF